MTVTPKIPIVEDDDAVRDSLVALLEAHGLDTEAYGNASTFFEGYTPRPTDCVVLDVRLPGMDGLEILEQLCARDDGPHVVMITGHGDLPIALRAMRAGAFDFLEKPYKPQTLIASVERALAYNGTSDARAEEVRAAVRRVSKLTPTEHDVLKLLIGGNSHDEIALKLDVTPPSVSRHRSDILEKLEARSFGEAIRCAFAAGLID